MPEKVGHNFPAPFNIDPIMCKLMLDLAAGPKPNTDLHTGPTAEFVKADAMVSGSGLQVEAWIHMILTRLADPIYILICP